MKNVSLTFSIQVSGLKCHYEQYFPSAQPLLLGGGFCAASSIFPFPVYKKMCFWLHALCQGPSGGRASGHSAGGPGWVQARACLAKGALETLPQLWTDGARALGFAVEFRLKVLCLEVTSGAGWGRSPPRARPAASLCPALGLPSPGTAHQLPGFVVATGGRGICWQIALGE